ncbi:MAG: calcium-binding protein, partial [Chthonomonadales bacterium]
MSPGTVANWAGLDAASADTIYGGSGTNYIYGSGGNDVIVGSSGHYVIYTGNGNSHITTGTGNSTIYGGTGNDTIVAEGNDNIQTGDGNAYVQVEGGDSTIYLGSGNDTIEAGSGNALVVEGSGHATFIVGIATGLDTIQANTGGTTVQLAGGLNESNLIVRDVNGNLLLSNVEDPQLQVQGYFSNGGEVSIQFADGTIWGASQILQASITPNPDGETDTLIGSDGNDSIAAGFGDTFIQGTSGNNTLTGGAGDDTIRGGSGADTIEGGAGTTLAIGGTGHETYLFKLGEGSETISESTTSAWTDALQFGAGIDPSQVTYSYGTSANDLVIQLNSDSDSTITISNYWTATASQHQIGPLQFSNGITVSRAQILQVLETIDGTTGDDDLRGNGVVNYFDGKGGNDFEAGNSTSDTFVFNQGYGHLEVYEDFLSDESTPILKLGAGITASSLEVWTPNGSDLYLSDGVSGDQILLFAKLTEETLRA